MRIRPYPGIIGFKSLNDFIAIQENYDYVVFEGTSYFMKWVIKYFTFLPFKCISYMIDVAKETPLSLLSGNRYYNAKSI